MGRSDKMSRSNGNNRRWHSRINWLWELVFSLGTVLKLEAWRLPKYQGTRRGCVLRTELGWTDADAWWSAKIASEQQWLSPAEFWSLWTGTWGGLPFTSLLTTAPTKMVRIKVDFLTVFFLTEWYTFELEASYQQAGTTLIICSQWNLVYN